MSSDHDVTRIVRSWLEQGGDGMPDYVLHSLADQLPRTRQRRPLRLVWRNPMTRSRLAIAGVTVVALLSVGAYAIGAPSSNRTGTPTASPTASAPSTPAAYTPPIPAAPGLPAVGTALGANRTYGVSLGGAGSSTALKITIPPSLASAGWQVIEASTSEQIIGTLDGSQVFGMALVDNTIANPCQWKAGGTEPPTGSTVQALHTALLGSLQRADGVQANNAPNSGMGGITGQFIRAQINHVSRCDDGEVRAWTTNAGVGPALVGDMSLLVLSNTQTILAWTNLDLGSDAFWQLHNTMCWANRLCPDNSLR